MLILEDRLISSFPRGWELQGETKVLAVSMVRRETHNGLEAVSPGLVIVVWVICLQTLFLIHRLLLPRAGMRPELL